VTPKEVASALFRRQPTERYGVYEHFWPETIRDNWINQGYPKDVSPEDHFGYDIQNVGGWFDTAIWPGRWEVVEETDETQLIRDGRGSLLRYWKKKSGTPEHVGFEITTPEEWGKVRERLLGTDRSRLHIEDTKKSLEWGRKTGRMVVFGNLFVFELMRGTIGDENFLPALLEEPDWVKDFCQVYLDFFKRHYAMLFAEAGLPDAMFVYEDLGYRNGPFCSPATMRELVLPYHKALVDFFKSYGLPVLLHSCGDIRKAVPMILEAGWDVLQPLEAKAGVNVVELARQIGDKIAFMGNIDVTVLNRNDKDLIRAEVEGKVKELKKLKASYFFHSDHSVPPDVSYESYKFALEVFRANSRL
jgi:uroporphyrinogen decarboxylase